jgi:hypothetical protein
MDEAFLFTMYDVQGYSFLLMAITIQDERVFPNGSLGEAVLRLIYDRGIS